MCCAITSRTASIFKSLNISTPNVPRSPGDSSQDLCLGSLHDFYVAVAGAPPQLGAISPDWFQNGVVVLVVQTEGGAGVYKPMQTVCLQP